MPLKSGLPATVRVGGAAAWAGCVIRRVTTAVTAAAAIATTINEVKRFRMIALLSAVAAVCDRRRSLTCWLPALIILRLRAIALALRVLRLRAIALALRGAPPQSSVQRITVLAAVGKSCGKASTSRAAQRGGIRASTGRERMLLGARPPEQ